VVLAQQAVLSVPKSPPLVFESSAVRPILAAIDMMTILTRLRRGHDQSCSHEHDDGIEELHRNGELKRWIGRGNGDAVVGITRVVSWRKRSPSCCFCSWSSMPTR
jgi:hypothetical protein